MFNGYVNQYKHAPVDGIQVGERVRAWVVDSGPSENSSWHVVGTIFDTLYKEGAYQLRPGDGNQGGAQTLDLQPAQGGFVEFTFDEEGAYPFVTHKFSNAGKGAMGLFVSSVRWRAELTQAHRRSASRAPARLYCLQQEA